MPGYTPPRLGARRVTTRWLATLALTALLIAGGCQSRTEALLLANKARVMWEQGQYADAARNFITLAEIHPRDPLAEESIFWAANLNQHFLDKPDTAIRYYQQLLVQYPNSDLSAEARENLAALYESDPSRRHRALQIYRQLLLEPALRERHDYFQFKTAALNLEMGKMDQARFEFRALFTEYPSSPLIPESYYLVGYSYFLEERFPLAMVAFRQAVRDFPTSPFANRAAFFIADMLEEQGNLKEALNHFQALSGKFHSQKIVDARISSLRARLKKGVR